MKLDQAEDGTVKTDVIDHVQKMIDKFPINFKKVKQQAVQLQTVCAKCEKMQRS